MKNLRSITKNSVYTLVFLMLPSVGFLYGQQPAQKIRLNEPIERTIKGDEAHDFQFKLKDKQFVRIEVEQAEIDVVVSLTAPDGKMLAEMDGDSIFLWRESVSAISEKGGAYKLQIKGKGKLENIGSYKVKIAELRKALPPDGKRIEAEQALIQAFNLWQQDKLNESVKFLETSMSLWREIGDKYWEAVTAWNLAWAYYYLNRINESFKLFNQSLIVFQDLKDRFGEANAYMGIGNIYRFAEKYELAKQHLEKALAIRRELKRWRSEFKSLNGLINIYNNLNQPGNVLESLNRMLLISRELKERKNEREILSRLGVFFFDSNQNQKSIAYLEQALEIDRELKESEGEILRLQYLGNAYNRLSQYEKAQKIFAEALEIAARTNDKNSESYFLNVIGGFNVLTLNNFDKGREFLLKALNIKRELKNDKPGEMFILGNLVVAYLALGEYEKVIEYSAQGWEISKEINNKIYQIDFLQNLGNGYSNIGQVDKAVERYEQSLMIARNEKLRLKEAGCLFQLSNFYEASEQFGKAIELKEQALLIVKDLKDKRFMNLILVGLGSIYSELKQYEKARDYYEQALQVAREANSKDKEIGTLQRLGLLSAAQNQFEKARDYFEQSFKIAQQSDLTYQQISILSSLGYLYVNQSRFEQGINYFERGLTLAEQTKNIFWQALLNSYLGSVYQQINQYEKAQSYYERSLAIGKESKSIINETAVLFSLGNMHFTLSQYEKARDYFEQVEKIAKETKNRWLLGIATSGIGSVYTDLSSNQKAQSNYEQALALMKEVLDRTSEGNVLNFLGNTYLNLKDYERAQSYYEQSLVIAREMKNKQSEVYPLINLGAVFQNKNQLEKAQSFYEQGLSLAREVKDRGDEGSALNGLGTVNFKYKKYHQAEDFYHQSLAIAREIRSKKLEAAVLHNLMELFREIGKPQIAVVYGKQAINIFQEIRGNIKDFDKESQQSYLKDKESAYRMLADLLITEGRLVEAQIILNLLKEEEYAQLARTGEKGEIIPYSQTEADVIAKIENLVALEQQLHELRKLKNLTDEQVKDTERLTREAKEAKKAFDETLKALAAAETSIADTFVKIRQGQENAGLQSSLLRLREKTNSGVVTIYTVLGKEEPKSKKDKAKDEKTKFGWVILVTEKSYKAYPIDVTNFNEKVLRFLGALQSDKYDPQPLAEMLYKAIFRQKSAKQKRTLEQDLQQYLGSYQNKTIMWSLDGVLRYIPMAALHDGKKYLVENYRNVIFTDKNFTGLESENRDNWQILGLGVSDARENFKPLPGVKIELETIIRETGSTAGILSGTIRLNENFKKREFSNLIGGGAYSVVHIATHYSFNPTQQKESFLLLGDGRLKFGEMDEDNLFGAVDLLALSACETGVSGNGKEAEGFSIKAQELGAKSVIASLWKVSDAGTPELMILFYKLRAENPQMSKGEAFWRAQISLLRIEQTRESKPTIANREDKSNGNRSEKIVLVGSAVELPLFEKDEKNPFAHPHYWASFVLIGNWR